MNFIEEYQLNRIVYSPLKSFILTFYNIYYLYPKANKQHQLFFDTLDQYKHSGKFNYHVELVCAARHSGFPISSRTIREAEKVLKVKYYLNTLPKKKGNK